MRLFIAVLMLLLVPIKVNAAPSLLGVCHPTFNCDGVNKLYEGQDKIVLSWLEYTFGSRCQCLIEPLNDAREKIIRAHLIQSPCMRNKRCGRYEALWGYTAASASRAALKPESRLRKRFDKVLGNFKKRIDGISNLTCYVSPCLECDLYERARRVLADIVSAAVPTCNIVDNPYRRKCLSNTICEKHGESPRVSAPCIVDMDGTDGSTIDVKQWLERYQACDLQFYWEPWMNCIKDKFVDPRKRDCSYESSTFENTKGLLCQYFYPLSDTCLL